MRIAVTLHLPKGYIGHPYWPERERVITIQKESGVNRARSLDKRDKTLRAYLDSKGITLDDYRALEARAAREFYVGADVDDSSALPDEIVLPAHHLHGLMAQAADVAPSSIRLAKPEQIRNLLAWSSLRTCKTKPDGTWERFVTVKGGMGNKLSNQRGLRVNQYIADVTATGTLTLVNPEHEKKVRQFIAWAGEEIGLGASRKLGWGRFVVTSWESPRS